MHSKPSIRLVAVFARVRAPWKGTLPSLIAEVFADVPAISSTLGDMTKPQSSPGSMTSLPLSFPKATLPAPTSGGCRDSVPWSWVHLSRRTNKLRGQLRFRRASILFTVYRAAEFVSQRPIWGLQSQGQEGKHTMQPFFGGLVYLPGAGRVWQELLGGENCRVW